MKGLLITMEGIEGSGKSTQIDFLRSRLSNMNLPYVCSREPGGTSLGRDLRKLLLAPRPSGEKWHPMAELLLFCADRAQHVETLVRPSLAEGKIVLLDRFEDSTRAYQGAQGLAPEILAALRQIVIRDLKPDLTILLDANPEKSLARANKRNNAAMGFSETRFDDEALAFHQKVREGFLEIASQEPNRVCKVNGEGHPEEVAQKVWAILSSKLKEAEYCQVPDVR